MSRERTWHCPVIHMNWLKDHAYLSDWLALPVAIASMVYQNRGKPFAEVDWSRMLIYVAFLLSLAVVFTPTFDETARSAARFLGFSLIGFLIVDRKPRK